MSTDFYNFSVTKTMRKLSAETLTASHIQNLVEAHFSTNYSYFGSIDKTLSGFFVLNNDGDDCLLLDRRDSQQIFLQSHEDRQLSLRFDGLNEYSKTTEGKSPQSFAAKKKKEHVLSPHPNCFVAINGWCGCLPNL